MSKNDGATSDALLCEGDVHRVNATEIGHVTCICGTELFEMSYLDGRWRLQRVERPPILSDGDTDER